MLKIIVCCFVIAAAIFTASNGQGTENMLGPGRWFVINVAVCENDADMEHRFIITRKKMNRTHDGFCAFINLATDLDDSFAIRINLCKHVDGGCKPYQVLSDESVVRFLNKYAKGNVEKALTMAKVDPPEFPIPAGIHELNDFMFDYCELPSEAVYGLFGAVGYLIKDEKEVACVQFTVEFRDVQAKCGEDGSSDESGD